MMLSGEDINKLAGASYVLRKVSESFNTTLNNASVLDDEHFFKILRGCVKNLEELLPEMRDTIDSVEQAHKSEKGGAAS